MNFGQRSWAPPYLYQGSGSGFACHPDAPRGGGGLGFFRQPGFLDSGICATDRGLPHPRSPAAKRLVAEQVTATKAAASFSVVDIPAIMRAQGWSNGAALLESWFSRPACVAPLYDKPEVSTVSMSWVLGFSRARAVYDKLIGERIWQNPAARQQIAKMLRKRGLLKTDMSVEAPFGDFSLHPSQLDDEQINFRPVKMDVRDVLGPLDDMSAALGNFVFVVLVSGSVRSDASPDGHRVVISQVGVYVRDSFDFNGDQFLGYWDRDDNSVSNLNPLSGTHVSNADFRRWREQNQKGGDFMIFSDLKVIKLASPEVFFVK